MASDRRGIFIPELCGKLAFRLNLRYHALYEKMCLREEDRLGDFTGHRGPKNHFSTAVTQIAA
jgi:hypothetical protein